MDGPFDLTGRVALVTGASSGIGAAAARVLAEQGARVAIAYHANQAGAESTRAQVVAAGGDARVYRADARREHDLRELAAAVVRDFGAIDVLVNNAGSLVRRMPLAAIDDAVWDEIYTLNVKSAVWLCQAVAPAMVERRRGVIVNVGSIAGHHGGGPGAVAYASAKAALGAFTRGLARELAPSGVRVNAIAPGVIDTPFHEAFSNAEMLKAFTASIPLGRLGTSAECGAVIAFLASDAAAFIVGATIDVNGGQLMR